VAAADIVTLLSAGWVIYSMINGVPTPLNAPGPAPAHWAGEFGLAADHLPETRISGTLLGLAAVMARSA